MEFLIIVIMAICYALLLFKRRVSLPLILGALSVEVIATFAILVFSGASLLGIILFVGNLLITPWIAFSRISRSLGEESASDGSGAASE